MMSRIALLNALVVVCVGAACRQSPAAQPTAAVPRATAVADEIAALKAEIEVLKGKAPQTIITLDARANWPQ